MLMPLFATAQTGWVNVEFQADAYGGESTWEIYMVGADSVYAAAGPFENASYTEQLVLPPVGEYNPVVREQVGNGL